MKEMIEGLAERMIRGYAADLVTIDEFVERLTLAGASEMVGERGWESLAYGVCGQILYKACLAPGGQRYELAFERLREYLARLLWRVGEDEREDVLQLALLEIIQSLRRERGRPARPASFLAWARVILYRQLARYRRRETGVGVNLLSLEAQDQSPVADLVDRRDLDPLDLVLRSEQRGELCAAIARLRNARYREVLLKTYFVGLDETELAAHLGASIADIYLWRYRGLRALRKQAGQAPTRASGSRKGRVA